MSKAVTPSIAQPTNTPKLPHEQIAQRAYEKWVKRGRPNGTHLQDWTEAETELRAEISRSGGFSNQGGNFSNQGLTRR